MEILHIVNVTVWPSACEDYGYQKFLWICKLLQQLNHEQSDLYCVMEKYYEKYHINMRYAYRFNNSTIRNYFFYSFTEKI